MNTIITVADVLQLEYFKNHRVAAGKKALNNVVTNAATTEIPHLDIIPPGTMVAITGINFVNDEESLCKCVYRLHSIGVSALCIKIGVFLSEIPKSVLKLGDELPIPIIISPPGGHPSGFTHNIMQIIYRSEFATKQLLGNSSEFVSKCIKYDTFDERQQTQFLLEAKITGYNVTDPYYILVYNTENLSEQNNKSLFGNILFNLRSEDSFSFGAVLKECHIFFYHPETSSSNIHYMKQKDKAVIKNIADILNAKNINLFVSKQLKGLHNFKDSLYSMISCIEISEYMKTEDITSPIYYEDSVQMLILHELLFNPTLCENYIQSILLRHLEKETYERRLEIIQFLRIYLKVDGKVKTMSKIMHVHPNTILYRIQYIENVYNCNLKNYNTRWNFQTAIALYDIIGNQKLSVQLD